MPHAGPVSHTVSKVGSSDGDDGGRTDPTLRLLHEDVDPPAGTHTVARLSRLHGAHGHAGHTETNLTTIPTHQRKRTTAHVTQTSGNPKSGTVNINM
jgi:hypothetical protein